MNRFFASALAVISIPALAKGQLLFQESFESDPGGTYQLSNQFDDGGFDFFDRYAVPDNVNAARDDFQNGWDGSFGILGQDFDGDGFDPLQSIRVPGIDVSGGTDQLSVTIALGGLNSEPDFINYEPTDILEIYSTVDANPRTLIGRFAPPAAGGDLSLDSDFDGIGDGVSSLTIDLADFSFDIPGLGNSLSIEIEMTSTDSFEPYAVDNVRIFNIPEPATLALLALGGVGLIRRRR